MAQRSARLAGRLRRARIRVAHGVITLGGALHGALAELGLWLEPKFGHEADGYRPPRPWAGLAVLTILLCGVALLTGGAVVAIIQALPHREARP